MKQSLEARRLKVVRRLAQVSREIKTTQMQLKQLRAQIASCCQVTEKAA
jgi:hypothetical protein